MYLAMCLMIDVSYPGFKGMGGSIPQKPPACIHPVIEHRESLFLDSYKQDCKESTLCRGGNQSLSAIFSKLYIPGVRVHCIYRALGCYHSSGIRSGSCEAVLLPGDEKTQKAFRAASLAIRLIKCKKYEFYVKV